MLCRKDDLKFAELIPYNKIFSTFLQHQNQILKVAKLKVCIQLIYMYFRKEKGSRGVLTKLSSALLSHWCLFLLASMTANFSWSNISSCPLFFLSFSTIFRNSSWSVSQPTCKYAIRNMSTETEKHETCVWYNHVDKNFQYM